MGKPTASCFKMIACGGDSVDHDDLHTTESKSSSDRRGWSFRKRSARHRVLSNSGATETPPSDNKETPESTAVNFHVQTDLPVPEKTSVVQLTEEKIELSSQPNIKESGKVAGTKEEFCGADATPDEPSSVVIEGTPDEPSIIVIQAAIRTLLAQKVLLKQKNIIKLQAVVRGHLVRSHATGTLRCVQSIIRMQALVRARHSRLLAERSGDFAKQSKSSGNNCNYSTIMRKKNEKTNGPYTYVSIDKLLSNAFARQLMESTPRTKPINIKCDPSKSDSAWKWLERWMSVSSVTSEESLESETDVELGKEQIGHSNGEENIVDPIEYYSEPTDFISGAAGSVEVSKKDDKEISDVVPNNLDAHSFKSVSPSSSHSDLHSNDGSDSRYEIVESASIETKEVNLDEKVDSQSLPKEERNEQDEPDSEKVSTEQPETEAKRFTRKPSNPAFIAAQSKFEELSSAAPSAKVLKSSIHNPGVDSGVDDVSSSTDQPIRYRDFGLPENASSNLPPGQVGGSECGTELSISSTLDSPERSVTGGNEIEQETKVSEDADHGRNGEILEHGGETVILETAPSLAESDYVEGYECINTAAGESMSSMIAVDSPVSGKPDQKEPEVEPIEPQLEVKTETSHPVKKSSPEGSPRSHITAPESQATPSTEVSTRPKKNKGEKTDSNRKNKSSSADKKSLSNRNQDSALRSSLEQLQENKAGKRRNSLGSGKSDQKDKEKDHAPRDSSSSNSLPSYMQATESARAKAISNGSPRSSPDVHDKDIYIKKRHSLPGSNERQGSPRIQRSLSQAQQNAKGSVTQSPQERMWRR